MIGACGGIGSTVALGVAALKKKLIPETGLVSALPVFESARLVDPGEIVLGGHEIRAASLTHAARELHDEAGLFEPELLGRCAATLRSVQKNIRPGTLHGASKTVQDLADPNLTRGEKSSAAIVERLRGDIVAFREAHRLDQVVVVNVASSEPPVSRSAAHGTYCKLKQALGKARSTALPPSSLYALAALEADCPFINFTPSPGISIPAIQERAHELNVPYMGNDGKTGETLIKSVLVPMFATRNLRVLSWVGENILGNRDGAVLSDPKTRVSKINSKKKLLSEVVGYPLTAHVGIDYVPSLGDWKVAWDFIHFAGFLNTKMSMQFTWQGCDSILAAPLVIDLARLAAFECRWARGGPMGFLACFFKDPIDVTHQDYATQWRMLVEHVTSRAADCGIRVS
jgi:myo-inositol-1-phosphate synthase